MYWLSDLLPLANSMGMLRSNFLLKAGMPFLRFLPSVPPDAVTPKLNLTGESPDEFRRQESRRLIRIPRSHVVDGAVFYVVNVDGRYAGEFRYSSLRILHSMVTSMHGVKDVPPFPHKQPLGMSDKQRDERRIALEKFLQFVLAEPAIVETQEFLNFVKQHRRWEQDLPILASPLLGGLQTNAIPNVIK